MSENKKRSLGLKGIIEKIQSNKKIQIILIAILSVFVLIIFFSSMYPENLPETMSATDSVETYVTYLENKLSETLGKVNGAGKVSVVINVKSGMETVLAMEKTTTETASGIETVDKPILVNGKTVVVKELYPEITGVLIVAEGANNFGVLSKIQQATVSLLDIELKQIEILTMK